MPELVVGVNSFVNLDEANEIVNSHYTSLDNEFKLWNELSDSDKSVLLIRGTRLLNTERFLWKGQRVLSDQPLTFPRKLNNGKVVEFDSAMKVGLLELVIKKQIAKANELDVLKLSGVASFSDGGGMSVKFGGVTEVKNGENFIGSEIPLDVFNTYFKVYTMLV